MRESFNPQTHKENYNTTKKAIKDVGEKISGDKTKEELLALVEERERLIAELEKQHGDAQAQAGLDNFRFDTVRDNVDTVRDKIEKLQAEIAEYEIEIREIGGVNTEREPGDSKISAVWYTPDNTQETITLDIEAKLQDFLAFYQKTNIDLPKDFEDTIRDIWHRNQGAIEQAIQQNGFDDLLAIPGSLPLADLAEKMKMEKGYACYQVQEDFSDVVSRNVDKPRILLYHRATLPEIQAKTGLDIHLNITAADAQELYQRNPDQYLGTLEELIVMEKKNFDASGRHLSDWNEKSATWLPGSKAGVRFVSSDWDPDYRKLSVYVNDLGFQYGNLGVRPARCFF